MAKQEILPPEGGAVAAYRYRHNGWTPARQHSFLHALRETGCIRQACDYVGLSRTSFARARRRLPSFGEACELALTYRLPALERAACERAINGWEEPVYHGGKLVGQRRRYSDALLRLLILRGDVAAARAAEAAKRAGPAIATREETAAAIMKKLDAIEARRAVEAKAEAAAAAIEADRLRAFGLVP